MVAIDDRLLEREITDISVHITREELKQYETVILNKESLPDERLKAYCIVFTFYRRRKDINKCIELFEEYKNTFSDKYIIYHLYSVAIRQTGRKKDIVRSVDMAREALALQSRNAGALHSLAESLYLLAESDGFDQEKSIEYLKEAKDLVEDAISAEHDYPKFYSTRAKISSALGDYFSALRDVAVAIEKEDSSSTDYGLRVSDYLAIRYAIKLREAFCAAENESKIQIEKALDEARRSHIEVLSFFVAAVSFVIGGIHIAISFVLVDAVRIILVLAASMLMAISGFTLLYDAQNKFKRFFQAFVVGIMILVVAVFVPYIIN